MNECLQHLLRTPLFAARERHHLPLRAYMDLTIRRMHAIFNAGVINNDMWLGQPDESHFRALCEQIGVIGAYDYALYSSLVDHMIAANALLTQGSPEQVARYRDEVIQMRAVYAFGCTEIASGTDVRNLKTTVTYDPARHCLVLDSPCAGACKYWIGNSLYAAQVAMVLARLQVNGEDQGHHWFRVVIRDAENGPLRPGVRVMACDPKGGIHANQVGGLRFCQMQLDTDALLQRHARFTRNGQFVSDLPKNERFINALETFLQERLLLMAASRLGAGLSAHLAYQFARHRLTQAGPLLGNPLFRQRLYNVQLKALALKYLEQAILERFEAQWPQTERRKDLHILAALSKCIGTWMGLEVIAQCRELCGSQGFHHYNQIVTLRMDFEISPTFAGDNSVMAYQVIKDALSRPRFDRVAPCNPGQAIERSIVRQCRDAGDFSHPQAVGLTYARALDLIIQALEGQPLEPGLLRDLIAVFVAYLHRWGLAHDDEPCASIARIACLGDWLTPPDELVDAPIAKADYIQQFTRALYEDQ